MSRNKEQRIKYGTYLRGKTYEEVFGKEKAKIIKAKLSKAKTGKKYPKISKANKGRVGYFTGYKHSKEARDKISKASIGRKWSEETRKTMNETALRGENHPNWQGGDKEYGKEFKPLREQIRKRDNYRCQECFRHQNELYTKTGRKYKLLVHHIDYNKKNNNPLNLISLCRACHLQTNYSREDWTNYFKNHYGIT